MSPFFPSSSLPCKRSPIGGSLSTSCLSVLSVSTGLSFCLSYSAPRSPPAAARVPRVWSWRAAPSMRKAVCFQRVCPAFRKDIRAGLWPTTRLGSRPESQRRRPRCRLLARCPAPGGASAAAAASAAACLATRRFRDIARQGANLAISELAAQAGSRLGPGISAPWRQILKVLKSTANSQKRAPSGKTPTLWLKCWPNSKV